MKNFIKLSSILLFNLLGISSFSQTNETNQFEYDNSVITDAAYYSDSNFVGTFQIIHKSKDRDLLTYDIYYLIEARRSDTEVIMWEISKNMTIRIFPKNLVYPPTNFRIQETEILDNN